MNKSTVLTLPKDRMNTDYGVLMFGKTSFNNFDESKYYENGVINQKGKDFIYNALKDKHRSIFFGARVVFDTEEKIDLNKLTKNEIQGLEWSGNQYSLGVLLALKLLYKKPTYISSGILSQIENIVIKDYPACYEAMLKLPANTVSEEEERLLESTSIQRVQFKVSMPIAVARQIVRHRGFDYTEVSRRYTDKMIEFFKPSKWRKQAKKATDCSIENEFVEEVGCNWFNGKLVYDLACEQFGKELIDRLIDIENRLVF